MNKPIVATGTGKRILRIVGIAGELADAMDNISLSLSIQAGYFQVSIAVSQMDAATQTHAVFVEESSPVSQS